MAITNIFSNNLDPANLSGNLSSRFSKATGFFIYAPFLATQGIELSIDVFIQTFIKVGTIEFNRLTRIAKIEEQTILLNIADTDGLTVLPSEFMDVGEIEYALLFVPTDNTYLEAYAILPDTNLLEIEEALEEVKNKLDALTPALFSNGTNNLSNNLVNSLLGLGLFVSDSPQNLYLSVADTLFILGS